jgi:hypothetical protein
MVMYLLVIVPIVSGIVLHILMDMEASNDKNIM